MIDSVVNHSDVNLLNWGTAGIANMFLMVCAITLLTILWGVYQLITH